MRICMVDWCDKKVYAKKLCRNHYEWQRQGKPLTLPDYPKPMCNFTGCDRVATSNGFCQGHYMQDWLGKPMKPLAPRHEVPERPGQRWCKTCHEWKDREEDFYASSNRVNKQAECKACQITRNRRNKLNRQGSIPA